MSYSCCMLTVFLPTHLQTYSQLLISGYICKLIKYSCTYFEVPLTLVTMFLGVGGTPVKILYVDVQVSLWMIQYNCSSIIFFLCVLCI